MEFLFDDAWVDRRAGVRRVLGTARKEPGPLFADAAPWEAGGASRISAVIFDPEPRLFKLWYRTRFARTGAIDHARDPDVDQSEREDADTRRFNCYAESEDGLAWRRPELGLFEFQGSTRNNILHEMRAGHGLVGQVIKDPHDPDPARRYKSVGFVRAGVTDVDGVTLGKNALCVGYSPDGLSWPGPPRGVMGLEDLTDAPSILSRRDPVTGKWVGFFRPRVRPKRRFIGHSESDDFEHWTYPRMLLTPDNGDDEWMEFYNLVVTVVGHWRVGSMWIFHHNPEASPMTQELVYSRDGLHYHRAMPGEQLVPLGPPGSFDSRRSDSAAFFEHDGEFRLYYSGSNQDHAVIRPGVEEVARFAPGERPRTGLGLARFTWGHFCGLRADFDGLVESKWLTNYGNAGVQALGTIDAGGWIRAEIADQFGAVIPGWDRSVSHVEASSDGRLYCTWGDALLDGRYGQESTAGGTVGHVVKLRFHLHKATLFGFQVGEEDAMPTGI